MLLERLSVVCLLAGFAFSAQAAQPAARKPQPAPRSDDLICTYEQPVGTHIKRRTCATRAERDERARRDQEAMQRMRGPAAPHGSGAPGN